MRMAERVWIFGIDFFDPASPLPPEAPCMPARGTPNHARFQRGQSRAVFKDNRNRHIPHGVYLVHELPNPLELPPLIYQKENSTPQCLFDLYASAMKSCLTQTP